MSPIHLFYILDASMWKLYDTDETFVSIYSFLTRKHAGGSSLVSHRLYEVSKYREVGLVDQYPTVAVYMRTR